MVVGMLFGEDILVIDQDFDEFLDVGSEWDIVAMDNTDWANKCVANDVRGA